MVDQVVEHPIAEDAILRFVDPGLAAGHKLPVLVPLLRDKFGQFRLGLGYLPVKSLQQGLLGRWDVGIPLVIRGKLQLVGGQSGNRPLPGCIRDVSC